jgi:SHAQKYF class myb-like DNA-binding protein
MFKLEKSALIMETHNLAPTAKNEFKRADKPICKIKNNNGKTIHKKKDGIIKYLHYSNGKWSREEHEMLLFALDILGNHWKAIQLFIGTRSSEQIRSHVQKHFQAIKREAYKKLKKNHIETKKPFLVTKQYMNYPFRLLLTTDSIKQVDEMKEKWFSLHRIINGDNKTGEAIKEDFELPPLGNLPAEDKMFEPLGEIKSLEIPGSPRKDISHLGFVSEKEQEQECLWEYINTNRKQIEDQYLQKTNN